ncbi:hypothetical protein CR513_24190, partial [Mucuna pruriens]
MVVSSESQNITIEGSSFISCLDVPSCFVLGEYGCDTCPVDYPYHDCVVLWVGGYIDRDDWSLIKLFVDDNVYNHISSEINVMTLWEKIEFLYASKRGNKVLS